MCAYVLVYVCVCVCVRVTRGERAKLQIFQHVSTSAATVEPHYFRFARIYLGFMMVMVKGCLLTTGYRFFFSPTRTSMTAKL